MIRYRPYRVTLSASIKDEQIFDTMEDLLSYVVDYWGRVIRFMGGKNPLEPGEIFIGDAGRRNPLTGYKNEHMVFASRMTDTAQRVPLCIGYIDMEAV